MSIYKNVESLEVVSWRGENEDFDRGVMFILEKLDALPVADVEKVVRCKDCRHRIDGRRPQCVGRHPDYFCADGIRRIVEG